MRKILWFSGLLAGSDRCNTGTWLDSMSQRLVSSGQVSLGNICTGKVFESTRQDFGSIKQWIVPASAPSVRNGLPSKKIITDILRAVDEFSPDLIHIWGVESFAGLLTARGYINQPALLEMQGLKGAIAKNYAGGLTAKEQRQCIGFKELIKWRTISREAHKYEKWGIFENEIIRGHRFISTQTDWIDACVRAINPDCETLQSARAIIINAGFNNSDGWKHVDAPVLFCSAAYSSPFKGLHIAIRAVSILKEKFPHIQLRIAGAHSRHGIRKDGYISWVEQQIRNLGIAKNVTWVGPLNANQINSELLSASVFILPSFIENCSTSMQEAMMVGTPIVASYAGGLPGLARDEESALFFPVGDEVMCARQVERLLTNEKLASYLSLNSRLISRNRNAPEKVLSKQLENYELVIQDAI